MQEIHTSFLIWGNIFYQIIFSVQWAEFHEEKKKWDKSLRGSFIALLSENTRYKAWNTPWWQGTEFQMSSKPHDQRESASQYTEELHWSKHSTSVWGSECSQIWEKERARTCD